MRKNNPLFGLLSSAFVILFSTFGLFLLLSFKGDPYALASVKKPDTHPQSPSDLIGKEEKEDRMERALEFYKLGEQYSQKGKVNEAIEEYRKALRMDPNFAEAHLNLGWSYALKKNDYGIALQETLEAIRLKPDLKVAYRNLWWIYRLQKNYEKALDTLKKIVQLEPDNAINYLNLGDAYVSDTRDFKLAVQSYKKGLDLDPNNIYIHRKLGKVYEFEKRYDLAIEEYKKAAQLRPMDPYTFLFWAVSLGKAGRQMEIPPIMKNAVKTISEGLSTSDRWDIDLLKYFAGEISESNLFAKARDFPIHRCQALYYSGLKHAWEGEKSKGIEFLTECQSMDIDALSEYEYSRTELYLLNKSKP
ncbi:MAG: tetratricopeptide repeat protein [bacterium]